MGEAPKVVCWNNPLVIFFLGVILPVTGLPPKAIQKYCDNGYGTYQLGGPVGSKHEAIGPEPFDKKTPQGIAADISKEDITGV